MSKVCVSSHEYPDVEIKNLRKQSFKGQAYNKQLGSEAPTNQFQ